MNTFHLFMLIILGIPAKAFDLTILHTNDVHARFEEINQFGGPCSAEESSEGKCYGGVARRHTIVQEVRKTGKNVLFLDAGDQFQGTIWFLHYKGQAAAHFNNLLGYDVGGLGNHELDEGPDVLADYIQNVSYPIVNCNIDASGDPHLNGLYSSSVILDVGGEKVAVFGYLSERLSHLVDAEHIGNLIIKPEMDCIQSEVNKLKASGVNKIIALGSVQFQENVQIAQDISGIDVIVGGHSNTFLYTGTPPSNEIPAGEYPHVVTNKDGHNVYIVYAYALGKYIGLLDLTFDESGIVTYANGNPMLLDNTVPKDPFIESEVQKWVKPLIQFRNTTVGESYVKLNASCRRRECNLGNLVSDAILNSQLLQQPKQGEGWSKASVAVYNSGGIRNSLHQGDILLGTVMEVLPFRNEISGFTLQGKYVKEMLETSVRRVAGVDPDTRFPHGGFLQMSGLKVTYDLSKAPGYRVHSVMIRCSECTIPVYEPLDMEKKYGLVTSAFLLKGGDKYTVLKDYAEDIIPYGFITMDAVVKYLKSHSPIIHGEDGRIHYLSMDDTIKPPITASASRNWHFGFMCVVLVLMQLFLLNKN